MQQLEKVSDEVYYAPPGVVSIGAEELAYVKARAAENSRRRARLCTHPSTSSVLQEMFIVHAKDAYVRPHAHPNDESAWVIEGSVDLVLYDDAGAVTSSVALGDGANKRYYRIPAGLFHALVVKSEWVIFHETTLGPFEGKSSFFPAWAPEVAQ